MGKDAATGALTLNTPQASRGCDGAAKPADPSEAGPSRSLVGEAPDHPGGTGGDSLPVAPAHGAASNSAAVKRAKAKGKKKRATKRKAPRALAQEGTAPEASPGGDAHRDKRTQIPTAAPSVSINQVVQDELDRYRRMEEALGQRVLGQRRSIQIVCDVLCCSLARLTGSDRPLASFLFLGPSGVGKTELAKAIAQFLSPDRIPSFFEIDIAQYCLDDSVPHLVSALARIAASRERVSLSGSSLSDVPVVLVIDNIERASPQVASILLGIVTEGVIFDTQGNSVSFKNDVICLNSNAGCQNGAGVHDSGYPYDHLLQDLEKDLASPLLYRLDRLVAFNELDPSTCEGIVDLHIKQAHAWLKDRRISLRMDDDARKWIAERGYHQDHGARLIEDVFRSQVIIPLTRQLLHHPVQSSYVAHVYTLNDEVCVNLHPEVKGEITA